MGKKKGGGGASKPAASKPAAAKASAAPVVFVDARASLGGPPAPSLLAWAAEHGELSWDALGAALRALAAADPPGAPSAASAERPPPPGRAGGVDGRRFAGRCAEQLADGMAAGNDAQVAAALSGLAAVLRVDEWRRDAADRLAARIPVKNWGSIVAFVFARPRPPRALVWPLLAFGANLCESAAGAGAAAEKTVALASHALALLTDRARMAALVEDEEKADAAAAPARRRFTESLCLAVLANYAAITRVREFFRDRAVLGCVLRLLRRAAAAHPGERAAADAAVAGTDLVADPAAAVAAGLVRAGGDSAPLAVLAAAMDPRRPESPLYRPALILRLLFHASHLKALRELLNQAALIPLLRDLLASPSPVTVAYATALCGMLCYRFWTRQLWSEGIAAPVLLNLLHPSPLVRAASIFAARRLLEVDLAAVGARTDFLRAVSLSLLSYSSSMQFSAAPMMISPIDAAGLLAGVEPLSTGMYCPLMMGDPAALAKSNSFSTTAAPSSASAASSTTAAASAAASAAFLAQLWAVSAAGFQVDSYASRVALLLWAVRGLDGSFRRYDEEGNYSFGVQHPLRLQCGNCRIGLSRRIRGQPVVDPTKSTFSFLPIAWRCSGCRNVYYCSPACQAAHWPQHSPQCADPKV